MAFRNLPDGMGGIRPTDDSDLPVNMRTLLDKADQAMTSNATYLALGNPTAAQNTAQIKALTRQVNALVRLTLGRHEDTTGT